MADDGLSIFSILSNVCCLRPPLPQRQERCARCRFLEKKLGWDGTFTWGQFNVRNDILDDQQLTAIVAHPNRILLQEIKPALDFKALIIVEPMVSALGRQHLDTLEARLVCAAHRRRDRWPTGKAAFESFQKLTWDPRIIQAYLVRSPATTFAWDNIISDAIDSGLWAVLG